MWSVDDIYQFSNQLINKAQMQTYEPDALFYIWNSEQRAYYLDLLGRWQRNSNGKNGANTGLIENNVILEKLSSFMVKYYPTLAVDGIFPDPDNIIQFLAVRVNGFQCKEIRHDQIAFINNSVIDGPSVADNRYYYVRAGRIITIYPTTVSSGVEEDVLIDCVDIKWAFIDDPVTGLPVYDPGNSVQPQWNNFDIQEITARTMKKLGVHFSDRDFQNYGASVINTGN